jgi:hypothetical protein
MVMVLNMKFPNAYHRNKGNYKLYHKDRAQIDNINLKKKTQISQKKLKIEENDRVHLGM